MTPIKIIDRRCSAPDDPEAVAEAEKERQARRRAVREAAARRDIELQPALLAEQDIRDSEARCDALADDHQRTCQVWQDELQQLERRAIERIGRREPADTEEDDRRAELSKLIASATAELEKAIAVEHELQAERRRTARRIRQGHPPSDTILVALTKPPLVNPTLAIRSFCCEQRIKWARARAAEAMQGVKIQQHNLDGIRRDEISGDAIAVEIRLGGWRAELEAAEQEQAAALAESNDIRQQKIDE